MINLHIVLVWLGASLSRSFYLRYSDKCVPCDLFADPWSVIVKTMRGSFIYITKYVFQIVFMIYLRYSRLDSWWMVINVIIKVTYQWVNVHKKSTSFQRFESSFYKFHWMKIWKWEILFNRIFTWDKYNKMCICLI